MTMIYSQDPSLDMRSLDQMNKSRDVGGGVIFCEGFAENKKQSFNNFLMLFVYNSHNSKYIPGWLN